MSRMKIIGLTGGIASGKGEVASLLREAGFKVINLDEIGKDITDLNSEVITKISQICQEDVKDGKRLNRTRVREIVFADPGKRAQLEQLLHPLIQKEFETRIDRAKKEGDKLIFCEAALLIESKLDFNLSGLLVVLADTETRIQRLCKRDGISIPLAKQMIDSQIEDGTRRSHATYIIENNHSLEELRHRVQTFLESIS